MRAEHLPIGFGAEIHDLDLDELDGLEPALRHLLSSHGLLVVRNEGGTDEQHDRLMRCFGPLQTMPNGTKAEYVTNRPHSLAGVAGTGRLLFHADGAYGPRPGLATSLWAKQVSDTSPPTLFASGVRALEALPDDLRLKIRELKALHLVNFDPARSYQRTRLVDLPYEAPASQYRKHAHPMVMKAPHTGIEAVFVNELLTSHIVGLPIDESEQLLQAMFDVLYRPDGIYAHQWRTGDIIVWDNIALQHARPAEIDSAPRHLRRLSLDGWILPDGLLDWRPSSAAT